MFLEILAKLIFIGEDHDVIGINDANDILECISLLLPLSPYFDKCLKHLPTSVLVPEPWPHWACPVVVFQNPEIVAAYQGGAKKEMRLERSELGNKEDPQWDLLEELVFLGDSRKRCRFFLMGCDHSHFKAFGID